MNDKMRKPSCTLGYVWEGFFYERRTATEEMNGDLRKKMDKANGDLRKISVYMSGDSGYDINKEVENMRTMLTQSLAVLMPFNVQEMNEVYIMVSIR